MNKDSEIFERRFVSQGGLVMREGEPGNCAYLVQSGRVIVYTQCDGQKVELARLGVGEIFGEMALASDIPRSATVQALEDCNLIVITREALNKKIARSDATVQAIVKMLIRRMISSNNAVAQKRTSFSDLSKTSRTIYKAILAGLPQSQKKPFENGVGTRLEDFLNAASAFEKRFLKKK